MRKIGELWRGMSAEERDRYEPTQAQVAEMQGRQKLPVSASVFQSAAGGAHSVMLPPGTTRRNLSAYNLFVRAMQAKMKEDGADVRQGEHMKKIGEMWRDMSEDDKAKWKIDGEEGSRVPGNTTVISQKSVTQPSAYQMFVKQMSKEFKLRNPESKQADNMRKIGECGATCQKPTRTSGAVRTSRLFGHPRCPYRAWRASVVRFLARPQHHRMPQAARGRGPTRRQRVGST
jgi:hypothetical protein